jgi:hypothetical protein
MCLKLEKLLWFWTNVVWFNVLSWFSSLNHPRFIIMNGQYILILHQQNLNYGARTLTLYHWNKGVKVSRWLWQVNQLHEKISNKLIIQNKGQNHQVQLEPNVDHECITNSHGLHHDLNHFGRTLLPLIYYAIHHPSDITIAFMVVRMVILTKASFHPCCIFGL